MRQIERVVMLQAGSVIADGPKEEVLTSERLSALFGVRVQLFPDGEYYHLHA